MRLLKLLLKLLLLLLLLSKRVVEGCHHRLTQQFPEGAVELVCEAVATGRLSSRKAGQGCGRLIHGDEAITCLAQALLLLFC